MSTQQLSSTFAIRLMREMCQRGNYQAPLHSRANQLPTIKCYCITSLHRLLWHLSIIILCFDFHLKLQRLKRFSVDCHLRARLLMNSNAVTKREAKNAARTLFRWHDEAQMLSYVLLRSTTNHDLRTSTDGRRSEDELMKSHISGTRSGTPIYK